MSALHPSTNASLRAERQHVELSRKEAWTPQSYVQGDFSQKVNRENTCWKVSPKQQASPKPISTECCSQDSERKQSFEIHMWIATW